MVLQSRNIIIDIVKGIAIIAVVLYHLGVSPYGYLGVDVFFVISGYFVALGLVKSFNQGSFSYWSYINKRLSRLWPGLVLISTISFVVGWVYMMPLQYKLNCESVVGTLSFTNNFVQYLTAGNYWSSATQLMPLMHTWYVGILMQFYIIIPLIFVLAKRFTHNWCRNTLYILIVLSLLSFVVSVIPLMTESQDFYLFPARFFELAVGSILAIIYQSSTDKDNFVKAACVGILCVVVILMFGSMMAAVNLRLISIVALSVIVVGASNRIQVNPTMAKVMRPLSFLGVASYSLYLTHQVLFAFYRYIVNSVFTTTTYVGILCVSIIVGVILYFVFEKPLATYLSKSRQNMFKVNGICLLIAAVIIIASGYYYKHNGLVRDIPELGLYVGEGNQTPEQYNGVPSKYDKDFESNGKRNIFVIGDSFGRDWINILREAGVDSVMNISYTSYVDENTKARLDKADYVFVATYRPFFESYNYNEIYPELFNRKFYRVGLKSFGEAFIGNVYNKRNSKDYYDSSVRERDFSRNINLYEKDLFRDNFIDMMTPLMEADGTIKLFTSDKKLITEDGIHLTKAGAKLYAEKLNVWQYLK